MAGFLMRTRWVWPLLALCGAGAALASLIVHDPPDMREWVLIALISLSFLGCGAIAWRREPLNPVGPLMIVFGRSCGRPRCWCSRRRRRSA